ncbi:ATP-binding cassette sub-family C member 4-like [Panonychus citri]|uniref:ATP-binding cassette sub-family C member 4-like n=1 Tax=Panonychus citri TaxID=50023 RepID=UPI0023076F52|nr:ATP-binding cassette sub-family C member 4-like [Panonychus citri]
MEILVQEKLKPLPHDNCNFFVRIFILWIFPLFRTGYKKKDLNQNDIYQVSAYDHSDQLRDQLRREWLKELKKKKPNLALAVIKSFGPRYIISSLIITGYEQLILKIAQPFLLGAILDYFNGIAYTEGYDIYYISIAFCLCSVIFIISHHAWLLYILRIGMKVRVAVQSLLMEKTFALSKSALYNNKGGNIINLMSNDVTKFDECAMFAHSVFMAPCEAIVISVILFNSLGYPYIIGLVLLLAFVPLQATIGRAFGAVRRKTAKWTDQRIRIMSEIISGMKVIKLYAWEKPFADMIAKIRRSEIMQIRKSCSLRAINFTLMFVTTKTILFAVFITYVLTGHELTAKNVFVTTAFFNSLRLSLTNQFPQGVSNISEALVSCKRLTDFLLLEEKKALDLTSNSSFKQVFRKDQNKKHLKVANLVATWDATDEEPTLNKVTFKAESGNLALVVGAVGSGKSSLLLAIMKEIIVKSGTIDINGTLSYASQESWTWNASIRDNITFGQSFDEQRYRKVLEVTALQRDVEILPYGDKTLVGERGVGLSGGQRARVNLARAIYREADIYLFDDPLSAVDASVAATIFQKCFKDYLKDKVVVLVTHQIQFLRRADKVLVLNEGKSKFYEDSSEFDDGPMGVGLAITQNQPSGKAPQERKKLERSDSTISTISISSEIADTIEEQVTLDEPRIAEESKSTGGVASWVYWAYIKAGANVFTIIICILLNLVSQLLFNGTDIWLSVWTNGVQGESTVNTIPMISLNETIISNDTIIEPQDSQLTYNSIVYSVMIVALMIITLARSLLFFYMCNSSSINLHNSIFFRVLRSPMSLFESQPIGRILNRFSRDLGILDELLPLNAYTLILTSFQVTGILVTVTYVSWYLAFPAIGLMVLAMIWRAIYIPTGQAIKRLEAITRSPVYSHISLTIDGLPTIRAFGTEEMFRDQFRIILNNHSSTWFLFLCASRSLGMWIDWTCVVYVTITTFVLITNSGLVPAGDAGMALSNAVGLTGLMQYFIRQSTEFESQMTSVERVVEYTKLSLEAELESEKPPPPEWPTKGLIKFNGVTLKYPTAPKPTLEDITIIIEPGEKIGVVGRTGAGKSSLLSCLFRIVEFEGALEIDGINIQNIGLHDLRKKVSIIPQEPVLFAGTVRTNLDPFNEHKDHELWEALDDVQLKETVLELHDHLDHEIREGGSNFSVGQRQLVCLGRALLRNNKVLVIDEATANVDLKTDSLIQHTIRTKFSKCTVLTIAHRLNTIIDSNRVLVLDAGQVVEFDIPYELLQKKSSIFSQLVTQTGKSMSAKLLKMAADARPQKENIMSEHHEDNHEDI